MACCGFDKDAPEVPGQIRVRGCTDVLWLCIFLILWCLMVGLLITVNCNVPPSTYFMYIFILALDFYCCFRVCLWRPFTLNQWPR